MRLGDPEPGDACHLWDSEQTRIATPQATLSTCKVMNVDQLTFEGLLHSSASEADE